MITIKKKIRKFFLIFLFIFTLSCNALEKNKKINNSSIERKVNLCIYCHKKRNIKNCKHARNLMSVKNCLKCHKGNKNHHGFKIKESPAF